MDAHVCALIVWSLLKNAYVCRNMTRKMRNAHIDQIFVKDVNLGIRVQGSARKSEYV